MSTTSLSDLLATRRPTVSTEATAPRIRKPRLFRPARLLPDRREESRQTAAALADTFRKTDCPAALDVLPQALAGNASTAAGLIAEAPAILRGFCALALHPHDVPADVMRATLGSGAEAQSMTFIEQNGGGPRMRMREVEGSGG